MRVRSLADETDVYELQVAHARAWRAAYDGLLPEGIIDRVAVDPPSAERVAAHFDRLVGYGDGRVHVVEDDAGTVRGYAVIRWGDDATDASIAPDDAELKELYVDPDCWGRGYGTALLEAGLDRLPTTVEAVLVEVLEGNDIGAGFYAARGFERVSTATVEIAGERYPTEIWRRPR